MEDNMKSNGQKKYMSSRFRLKYFDELISGILLHLESRELKKEKENEKTRIPMRERFYIYRYYLLKFALCAKNCANRRFSLINAESVYIAMYNSCNLERDPYGGK